MSKTKIVSLTDSKIKIIGDNVLFNNGTLIAYYLMPLTNYNVVSGEGSLYAIQNITNLLSGLSSQRNNIEFTLQRFSKTIEPTDVINNLYKTIRLYNPDYDMPTEFIKNLKSNTHEFCLLGIILDMAQVDGVEDKTMLETAKDMFAGVISGLFATDINMDEEKILTTENNIYNTIRTRCVRANRELVFYNYVSKLYPNYDISYDELSYVNYNNFSNILGAVTQTVEDNFGYFLMHNEGVDFFGYTPEDTYGTILQIKNFPLKINSEAFSMDYSGMQVNIKTLTKEQASIQLKRQRASDKWELDEALKSGAELEQLEDTASAIEIATHAISEVENGEIMCEFNANLLVTALTKEDLRKKIQLVQNDLKDRDILAAKSLTQAWDFINHYVKLAPQKYQHMTNLQFPLSFQLNSGSLVGNSDSAFFVPSIGVDKLYVDN